MGGPPTPLSSVQNNDISAIGGQLDGNDSIISLTENNEMKFKQKIPVLISKRKTPAKSSPRKCMKTKVKRSNKVLEAIELPIVLNVNPRSVYNKVEEFHTLVKELEVDLVMMSESWERETLTLDEMIELEGYIVISNVHQRKCIGSRPA